MTSEYLRYFIEVCNSGSIQAASKSLFVSSQGLSQGIKRLESHMGVKMLERSQSGVAPTEFGQMFYEQACVVERELQKLEDMAAEYKQRQKQSVTIGTIGRNKFYDGILTCVSEYCEKHPEQALDVSVVSVNDGAELYDGIRSGKMDICCMYHWNEYPDFKYYTMSDYSRVVLLLCADNPLAGRESVSFEELKDLRFVTAGENNPFSNLMRVQCEKHGFSPCISYYSTENTLISRLVDNDSAAILVREAYCGEISGLCHNAATVPISPELSVANSFLVSSSGVRAGCVHDLLEYLVDYFKYILGLKYTYKKDS